jgi:hypothetical protein
VIPLSVPDAARGSALSEDGSAAGAHMSLTASSSRDAQYAEPCRRTLNARPVALELRILPVEGDSYEKKSKKWEVCVEWTRVGFVELEAESEKEAMRKAVELIDSNAIEIKDVEDKDNLTAYYANEMEQ